MHQTLISYEVTMHEYINPRKQKHTRNLSQNFCMSFMPRPPVPEGRKPSPCSHASVGVPTGVALPYDTSSLPDENCERIWQLHTFNNFHLPHRGKTPCITAWAPLSMIALAWKSALCVVQEKLRRRTNDNCFHRREKKSRMMGNALEQLTKGDLEVTGVLKMMKILGCAWMSLKNCPICFYEPLLYIGSSK